MHRIAIKETGIVNIYDKISKNWMAQTAGEKIRWYAKPHEGLYSFPLYVGKKYKFKYILSGKYRSKEINRSIQVKSFEMINVEAGSFKVYKLIVKSKGVKKAYWYSPDIKIFVKKWEKHHIRGETTVELIRYRKG